MAPQIELANHSLYTEYSIPLKNSLTEETYLRHNFQKQDSFLTKKTSRTSRKFQRLSLTLRSLLVIRKVDANINDLDELRDSIHLSKRRIQSRQLDSNFSCLSKFEQSEENLIQNHPDSKASTSTKNELSKNKISNACMHTERSTFARNTHSLRAKAA
jgi:hypothetical protein